MSLRREKLQELFKEEASAILQRRLRDPRIGFVSVTEVELSADLRHAKIFVSVLGDEEAKRRTMEALDRVARHLPAGAAFDAVVTMECSTPERCGRFAGAVLAAPLIIAIDHHESHIPYGHLEDWDPAAAAAAEQVADLIRELGVSLSPAIATALLTGLATDTGVFRFPTVRPHSLRLAAELMEAGAPLAEIIAAVYEQRPLSANRLLGYALLRTALAAAGAVASSTLSEAGQIGRAA